MPGAGGGVLYVAGEGHVTAQPREAQSLRVGLPVRTGPPAAPTPQLPSSPPFRSWPLKVWSPEQQNWHHQGAYWRRRTLAPPRPPEPESAFQPGPQEACSRPIKVSEPALDPRPDITSSGTLFQCPCPEDFTHNFILSKQLCGICQDVIQSFSNSLVTWGEQ